MFLSMLVWILFGVVRKYRSDLVSRFVDLSSRSIDTARSLYRRNQRVKELERLKPKLFAIQKRLEQVKNVETSTMPISSSLRNTSTPLSIQDSGRIHYNAGALFDTLDKDHNKKLDFEELQRVMELKPEQLEAFVKRMNELAGNEMSSTSISRPVFVKYFLRVLEETSHFGPTTLEVEELFQELSQGEDWVAYSDFFHSRLAVFLSDPQINELIAKFRKCVASDEVSYNKRKSVDRSQQRSHGFQEQSTDGSNAPYIESQSKTSQQFNGQIGPRRTQSNRFSMRNMFAGQEVKRLIHRDMFCRYYAELLARVTEEATPEAQEENTRQMENGVDLAFEDLSLEVAVGDNKVNVVNQVSGRLPARTMTALMGGSGK